MRFLRLAPLLLLLTSLTSCGTDATVTRLNETTVEVVRPPLNLLQPAPLKLDDPQWVVVTPSNVEAVFAALRASGQDPVIVGTSVGGFKLIVVNNLKVRQLIEEYQAEVAAQKQYYETPPPTPK